MPTPEPSFILTVWVLLKDVLLHVQISHPQAMCTVPLKSSTFHGEKRQLLAAFQVGFPQLFSCNMQLSRLSLRWQVLRWLGAQRLHAHSM